MEQPVPQPAAPSTASGIDRLKTPILLASLAALLLVGAWVYRDFGLSWDEPALRTYGQLTLAYLETGERSYEQFLYVRYYGPLLPTLRALLERSLGVPAHEAHRLNHLLNYLLFDLGVVAFFLLCRRQFGSWRFGLLGAALLVLSPRVFSHAFVNPKDAPSLTLFIVNMLLLVTFLETRRLRWLVLLGVATSVLVNERVSGLVFPPLALLALLADELTSSRPRVRANVLAPFGLYLALGLGLAVAGWPFLWPNPPARFLEALRFMGHFAAGPLSVLYQGAVTPRDDLPWHYLPVWIGISTPIPYLALGLLGWGKLLRNPVQLFRSRSRDRFLFLYAGWLFVPLVLVAGADAVVYDEWRHVLFVYPALLLFAVSGARTLAQALASAGRSAPGLLRVALGAVLLWVAVQMVRLHPYQAVYFNALVGGTRGAQGRFEMDYWGLSYGEGLRFLLSKRQGEIRVHACTDAGEHSATLLPERERLRFVPLAQADFAVCAPRATVGEYLPQLPSLYEVTRDGVRLLVVKRVRRPLLGLSLPQR